MRHLFEEYGDLIIQAIGGVGAIALIVDMINPTGTLHGLIVKILEKAC